MMPVEYSAIPPDLETVFLPGRQGTNQFFCGPGLHPDEFQTDQ